jgi:hypothetical protein
MLMAGSAVASARSYRRLNSQLLDDSSTRVESCFHGVLCYEQVSAFANI